MKVKKWKLLFTIMLLCSLTSCRKESPEEKLFSLYEGVAIVEDNFEATSKSIATLEEKEAALYKQIIQDGRKNNNVVQTLLVEAMSSCQERERLIEKKLQMITEAYEGTTVAEKSIKKIKDQTTKEQVQHIQTLYENRYELFVTLADHYQFTIELEKQLYTDLKSSTQDLRALDKKIRTLNEAYQKNATFQQEFSKLSSQLNDGKKFFYQTIGISVRNAQAP